MKTKIIKIDSDWKDVKNVSRTTVNKIHSEKEATDSFKLNMLISEHSPIRLVKVRWLWKSIKSWISVHYSRHSWECFISTQRSDRTGVDRDKSPQDTPVNFEGEANAQHLIDTARKRLCRCASKETREYMEDLKVKLMQDEPELGSVLVPNCVYRHGCPEFNNCGFFYKFLYSHDPNDVICMSDIKARYSYYNKFFIKNSTH